MLLHAGCRATIETTIPTAASLMLRPISGYAQTVLNSSIMIDPLTNVVDALDPYGNNVQRVILPVGTCTVSATITAIVSDFLDVDHEAPFVPVQELPDYTLPYLLPSRYCQSDLLLDLATQVIQGANPGYDQVQAIGTWIHRNVQYVRGSSGPSTSAIDTANSRQGVCRDFSHLGIALCRALRIPARIVSGYLHGLDPMDLHLWFEAFVGGRWYAIDATQDEPRGGRLIVGYGRDSADVAWMNEFGVVQVTELTAYVNAG